MSSQSKAAIDAARIARRKGYIQDFDNAENDLAAQIDEAVKSMREAAEISLKHFVKERARYGGIDKMPAIEDQIIAKLLIALRDWRTE